MGIKTKFNPLGGRSGDKGKLSEWYYNTYEGQIPGIELKVYGGFKENVVVPKKNTILQDYVNDTKIYLYNASSSKTFYPSSFSALPDHAEFTLLGMSAAFVNIVNSSGMTSYSSPNDYLLPRDWSQVDFNIVSSSFGSPHLNFYATYYESPFVNNQDIERVNLQSVPWGNNSMIKAFYNCNNLVEVDGINNNIINMASAFNNCTHLNCDIQIPSSVECLGHTFRNCKYLNQNIQIPNLVTNMLYTFDNCVQLNQNIQIPDLVTVMSYTFSNCSNLNQNIQIPNSVIDMSSTFRGCSNLNQNIQIPNSVVDMSYTFSNCSNLNQNIQISNSVISMSSTFRDCSNLAQNIQIPSNVELLAGTFMYCSKIGDSWINICSTEVSSASACFNVANADSTPNVFIVADYLASSVVHTGTYNAFNSAGWKWTDGSIVGTSPNRIRTWSIGYSNYGLGINTTHYILNKWIGTLDTFLNNNVTWTTPQVPEMFKELGANIPVAINRTTFKKNASLTGIDLGTDIPWVGNAIGSGTNSNNRNAACQNCFNLTYAKGVIRGDVTDATATFEKCYNLTGSNISIVWPDSVTKYYVTYEMVNVTDLPPLGEGAANIQSMCFAANALVNYPVIPHKVTAMTTAFSNGCSASARGNIFILSPSIASANAAVAGAFFRSYNASNRRNIYIFYNYSNGTNTTTKTTFMKNAIYRGTSGNGTNPMYNSTSNIYVYNLSESFSEIWNSYEGTTSTTLLEYNKAQQIPHIGVFPQYPDYNVTMIGNNCFNGARNLITLALYNRPFNSTNLDKAFNNCQNLTVIQGLNLDGVTSLTNTFNNCRDLKVLRSIPDSVVNMANTFYNCQNFDFNVQIGNGVTDMYGTFSYCNNLNQNILVPDSTTNMSYTFYYCTNLNKNIQIPNSVVDASRAFYRCDNLNQNIQIPEGVTNIVEIFGGCYNLNQNIQIPNSVTDMSFVFDYCGYLNQNIQVPNSVTSLYSTFLGCYNLNQNIQIPNSVTNIQYTFGACTGLEGTIKILSENVSSASECFVDTTLPKNVYIPFKYSNGINTLTFNSFKTAGYILPDGTSNNQHGVTVYDLNEEV